MALSNDRIEKLVKIARMYYEENQTQSEIARSLGISRPLISRYLTDAREFGIVKIQIQSPIEERKIILDRLQEKYGIRSGAVIETCENLVDTNQDIADCIVEGLTSTEGLQIGVGWGSIIGVVADRLNTVQEKMLHTKVYPLVGNSGVFNRDYHSNEIVRIFAERTGGQPVYWYAPAFVDSPDEIRRLKELDSYKQMESGWKSIKVAFVNIGNYPSVPDFATAASYGSRLIEQKAVGKLLCYYYDSNGKFIKPDMECTMQIPLEILSKRKFVVGVCAANVSPKALAGALKTGIFTHVVAAKDILISTLNLSES